MSKFLGVVFIVVGVLLGLYVGGYVCFIGGIVQVVDAVRAEVLVSSELAWGIAKIVFAGLVGLLSGIVPFIAGQFFLAIK